KKWLIRRRILTPAFHFSILQQFISTFNEETENLVVTLKSQCQKPFVDINSHISQFTLKTIAETAMGTKLKFDTQKEIAYKQAIFDIGEIFLYRLLRSWLIVPLFNLFSPKYLAEKKTLKILHKFTKDVIAERQKIFQEIVAPAEDEVYVGKMRLAMLDLLLRAKSKEGTIDDDGIREEVDTFMFEGHDTTAVALGFALMLIACHKDVQDRIVQEMGEVLSDLHKKPTYNDLQEMKYMERSIKEVLRLYPSVHFISRKLGEDMTTVSGYYLPKSSVVHIHIYDLHHNPDIYPDPEKFDPDRFLPENLKSRHPFSYLPFSAGPRNCIGQRFAMLELKAAICGILANFVLEPVDTPDSIVLIPDLVLRTKDGIKIRFLPRITTAVIVLIYLVKTIAHYARNYIIVSKLPGPPGKGWLIGNLSYLQTTPETAMGTKLQFNTKKEIEYKQAVFDIGQILLYRLFHPWFVIKAINYFSPKYFEERRVTNTLHKFTKEVIAEREKNFKEIDLPSEEHDVYKGKKRLAMLDLLLSAKKKDGLIDDEGIREEVDTFMFEGHDTTAVALGFALMLLANNRHAQDKIVQEMREVLGDIRKKPSYNELQSMKYLERCIKESLRLYPSVHFITRTLGADLTMHNGAFLPKDTIIVIHIYDIHHDPNTYPDPEKFDPDRFLPENSQNRHPYAYLPFSAGPRNCIGQKFAMLELKAALCAILGNFILEPIDTPESIVVVVDIVLRTKEGIKQHVLHFLKLAQLPGSHVNDIISGNILPLYTSPGFFFVDTVLRITYFPMYELKVVYLIAVNVLSPKDCLILSNSIHMEKSIVYDLLHDRLRTDKYRNIGKYIFLPIRCLTTNMLLQLIGLKWQTRRKFLTSAFHFNILQQVITVFNKESKYVKIDENHSWNKNFDLRNCDGY
ncbi:p450 domain containing protein, partial [Asbolus verrucosus]